MGGANVGCEMIKDPSARRVFNHDQDLLLASNQVLIAVAFLVRIIKLFGYERFVFRFAAFIFDRCGLGYAALIIFVEIKILKIYN
jgi:hypothetical protein